MSTTGRRLLVAAATAAAAGAFVAAAAAAGAPANSSAPSISGTTAAGQTLTASPGSWRGDGSITYAYAWEVCDAGGGNCAVILHATSNSLTLAASEQGHTIRVLVTATNGSGSSTVASAATDPVDIPLVGKLTLKAPTLLISYGKKLGLSGTVPGAAHKDVWIEADTYPYTRYHSHIVATVQTDANGSFSVPVRPLINTTYYAEVDGMRSPSVTVDVAPRVLATKLGMHHWLVQALADKSLAGKTVVLQRWSVAQHIWISIKRLTLHGFYTQGSGFKAAVASVDLNDFGGAKTRIYLAPLVPGYAKSVPAVFRA